MNENFMISQSWSNSAPKFERFRLSTDPIQEPDP